MSSLGAFGKLPVEIRFQIWELVLCGGGDQFCNTHRQKRFTDPFTNREAGIITCMRLNKAIYTEISSGILYDQQKLEFTIRPEMPEGQPSGVYVCFAGGQRCWQTKLFHSYYADVAFGHASRMRLQHWHEIPLQKFKGVVVNIMSPDQHNPGETVALWNHLNWLLDLLVSGGARIEEITFRATEKRHWIVDDGALPCIVGNYEPDWVSEKDARPNLLVRSNLELFILPIVHHNLRAVIKVEVDSDELDLSEAKEEQKVSEEDSLEQQVPEDVRGPDHVDVAEWSLYLDLLLDNLPGEAADRLRLERFATWSDEYFWRTWTNCTGFDGACWTNFTGFDGAGWTNCTGFDGASWTDQLPTKNVPLITHDQQRPPTGVPVSLVYDTRFIQAEAFWPHQPRTNASTASPALRGIGLRLLEARIGTYRSRNPAVHFYTKSVDADLNGMWYTAAPLNGAEVTCHPVHWWREGYQGWPGLNLGGELHPAEVDQGLDYASELEWESEEDWESGTEHLDDDDIDEELLDSEAIGTPVEEYEAMSNNADVEDESSWRDLVVIS